MGIDSQMCVVVCVLFFSTGVRATFGFGDALVAMPIVAMIAGLRTATPLVALISETISLAILWRSWRQLHVGSAWRLIAGAFVGIPIGLLLLKGVHEAPLKLVLAAVLISFSGYSLVRPELPTLRNEKWSYAFGLAAGVLGGAYNSNGPPVVIYGALRKWPPPVFRATLQGFFVASGVGVLIAHCAAGLWTGRVLRTYALAVPVVLSSVWLGSKLHRRIPAERFVRLIYILLILVGLLLVVDTVRQWG